MPTRAPASITQRKNWVRATRATPMIFPNMSSVDFTEEMSTSTILLDFSSITLLITIPENIAMNIYMMVERIRDMIIVTSVEVTLSSPSASNLEVLMSILGSMLSIISLSPSMPVRSILASSTASFIWAETASLRSMLTDLSEAILTGTLSVESALPMII